MKKLNQFNWLYKLNINEPRKYDFEKEICYFPESDSYASLVEMSDNLASKGIFLAYRENFATRKFICNEDEEWRDFIYQLKAQNDFKCQLSKIGLSESIALSERIFGLPRNAIWINNWLTPHHTDGSSEYRCFDRTKIMILNRAIHMAYHRRHYLGAFIKREKPDYALYFEVGSLIYDRNGVYPWRNIRLNRSDYDAEDYCN